MDIILKYLKENYGKTFKNNVPSEVIAEINKLDRVQRGELRFSIYNEARKLGLDNDNQKIIFWLQNSFDLVDRYTFRMHKVYFSPGTDIMESISDLIKQATVSIDLCVFTITDNRLSSQIKHSYKKGIQIRIITDDQKMNDHGSEIYSLSRFGIPIKIDHSRHHMHHKFGIIDQRIALTGSFNWTYSASKHNQENLMVTTNYDIVNQYKIEFEHLWKEMHSL